MKKWLLAMRAIRKVLGKRDKKTGTFWGFGSSLYAKLEGNDVSGIVVEIDPTTRIEHLLSIYRAAEKVLRDDIEVLVSAREQGLTIEIYSKKLMEEVDGEGKYKWEEIVRRIVEEGAGLERIPFKVGYVGIHIREGGSVFSVLVSKHEYSKEDLEFLEKAVEDMPLVEKKVAIKRRDGEVWITGYVLDDCVKEVGENER